MGIKDVASLLNRSVPSIRTYVRAEGLPCRREGAHGRLVFDRDAVNEWRGRPEIQAMLTIGNVMRGRRISA